MPTSPGNNHLKHDRKDGFTIAGNRKKYSEQAAGFPELTSSCNSFFAFNDKPFACKH
jgi:hypothetical protein